MGHLRYQMDQYLKNTLDDRIIRSRVSSKCARKPCLLSLGEEGGGDSIFGPLVVAATMMPLKDWNHDCIANMPPLMELSRRQRMTLFNDCRYAMPQVTFLIKIISPANLSHRINSAQSQGSPSSSSSQEQESSSQESPPAHSTVSRSCTYADLVCESMIELIHCTKKAGIQVGRVVIAASNYRLHTQLKRAFPELKFRLPTQEQEAKSFVRIANLYACATFDRVLRKWKFPESKALGFDSRQLEPMFIENSFDQIFGYPTVVRFNCDLFKERLEIKGARCRWKDDDLMALALPAAQSQGNNEGAGDSQNQVLVPKQPGRNDCQLSRSLIRVHDWTG